MSKPFSETTLGKIFSNYADSGSIGSMEHSVDTGTIVKMGAILLGVGILFLAIKKFVFKN
ncbi:MAG: hypothetical protein R2831_10860 [Chitinophagaceae bacterium]